MTATPPDPHATPHSSTTDPDTQAPMDEQTRRLRDENRALRELLAAQAQAAPAHQGLGPVRRLFWWLISAPGAALVSWRALVGREDARPITGKRLGYATLTVLYTLAIYGALVLLVVSWSSPNTAPSGATAASPIRVPLAPLPALGAESAQPQVKQASTPTGSEPAPASNASPEQVSAERQSAPQSAPLTRAESASTQRPVAGGAEEPITPPRSSLRVTEIPAEDPMAWVHELKDELARCATLRFFERPDCSWAARELFCAPHRAWGTIKECPNRP
ncbi:hypothetical protein [Achromobacter insolitus]|uniref:hypothetical protein n=1 Tax=Achromobacter insolitus TaxID=217204 RepID=UPI0039C854C5